MRELTSGLHRLRSMAFGRLKHCGPLLKRFHALHAKIDARPDAALLWNIYDWLLVPLSLWPIDFEGLASHLLALIESSSSSNSGLGVPALAGSPSPIQNPKSKDTLPPRSDAPDSDAPRSNAPDALTAFLALLPGPPPAHTQSLVAEFERFVQSGQYEKTFKQAEKFDEQEKALLQNQQLAAEWAELKRLFDVTKYQNRRGVIRRRVSGERNFRENWNFDWSDERTQFQTMFDALCYRWNLYGMEHDRPLLLKISVNPTPHGTMIVIPSHWSLDHRRDLDWSLINLLHRARGAKKSGPKYSPGRIQKVEEAKKVRAAWNAGRKKGLKGDRLHEFICTQLRKDVRSDPSWWKRLLNN